MSVNINKHNEFVYFINMMELKPIWQFLQNATVFKVCLIASLHVKSAFSFADDISASRPIVRMVDLWWLA